MTVWEYKVETGKGLFGKTEPKPDQVRQHLDKIGEEGWELVTMLSLTLSKEDLWIYKRPMPMRKPKA
jgi:hypothetical protein